MLRKLVTAVMGQGYSGNPAERLLRHRAVRIPTTLAVASLALAALGACSDDDTPVTAGDEPGGTEPVCQPDADCDDVDLGPPDLVGTITSIEPFVPVTEDCTPAEDLDPDEPVSSDDPPVCTPPDSDIVGTVLVEEDPDAASGGRKVSFTATRDTSFAGTAADGSDVLGFADLVEGQEVETWVAGDACAESYPEQCGLAALNVTG
jgi:hypothetical protein